MNCLQCRHRVAAPPADRHHRCARRDFQRSSGLRAVGRGRPLGMRVANMPARSGLVASSPIQLPSCGVAPSSALSGSRRGAAWRRSRSRTPLVPPMAGQHPDDDAPAATPVRSEATARGGRNSAQSRRGPMAAMVGPKSLRCSSIADQQPVSASIAASAMRPSQPARSPCPHRRRCDQRGDRGRQRDGVVRVDHAAHVAEHQPRHHQPAREHAARPLVAAQSATRSPGSAERGGEQRRRSAARRSRCPSRRVNSRRRPVRPPSLDHPCPMAGAPKSAGDHGCPADDAARSPL